MPIQRLNLDAPNIVLKGGRDLDVLINGDYAGYIIADRYRNINKKTFLARWDNDPFLTKLMEPVPDGYRFNYYWLDYISLGKKFRGSGLGLAILEKWFSTLQHPACVALLPTKIDNVPVEALIRFYKKAGFRIFKIDGTAHAITFIKA